MWRHRQIGQISKAVPWSVERFDSRLTCICNLQILNTHKVVVFSLKSKKAATYVYTLLYIRKHLQYTPIDISTSSNDAM